MPRKSGQGGDQSSSALKNPNGESAALHWKKAAANVKVHDMPPEDASKFPSDEERRQFIESVGKIKYLAPRDPGPFVIRRLTKTEYAKATLYDMGTRVPLVVRWGKQMKAGRTVSDFVSLCDLAPTFLEAAGITPPKEMTGNTLFPQLKSTRSGQIDATRDHVLTGMARHCFPYPRQALRTDRYLYVRNKNPEKWMTGRRQGPPQTFDFSRRHWPKGAEAFCFNVDPSPTKQYMLTHPDDPLVRACWAQAFGPYPREELYDLKNDPGQRHNLAQEPNLTKTLRTLRSRMDKLWSESSSPSKHL